MAQRSLFRSFGGTTPVITAIRYGEHIIDFVDGGISGNRLR